MLIFDLEHLSALPLTTPNRLNGGFLGFDTPIPFDPLVFSLLLPFVEATVPVSFAIPTNQNFAFNSILADGTLVSTSFSSSMMMG